MDVRSLTRRSAHHNAARTAVVGWPEGRTPADGPPRRLTFAEAWGRAVRLANGLLAGGLRPGDRVGVLEDNTIEAADVFLGAAVAGLVRVPLYPRNSRDAHEHMLAHTGASGLVVSASHAGEVAGIEAVLSGARTVVVRDGGYEGWLAAQGAREPEVTTSADDPYIIRHTGGTTGRSKGVAYTHRTWLAAGRDWFYLFPPVRPGDVTMHLGPISHGSGYFFVPTWLSGGCNLLVPRFDPAEALALMESERVAYAFMVPTIVNALARHPSARQRDWRHLVCLQVGGAPITDDTALAARAVFGDVLWQGYGQTEAVPITMMGPSEWFAEVEGSRPLRSAGRPLPFADLEVRDPDSGAPLGPGAEGEIVVRCDGQMSGFWGDPAATAERIVDGWVRTGDIGKLDANGYLYVLDRLDDMIISGGFNIWPAELENAIASHPAVLECAVFGIPDDRWGETPCAVCTVVPGAAVSPEELTALCADRLGSYKKPGRVVLTGDPLPRTPVGKVQRKALREPFWAGHDRRVAGS